MLLSLLCLLAAALFTGYFYHVGKYAADRSRDAVCGKVNIRILDSLESSVIESIDVRRMLGTTFVGKAIDSIDLSLIERQMLSHGEISSSQAYISKGGTLCVAVTQRKPVARFENLTERYYSDGEGFLFPVNKSIDVQLVTGNIPLSRGSDFKGYASAEETRWLTGITSFIREADRNPYWKRHIQQIDIDRNGDILLYLDCGPEKIIFGDCRDTGRKLRKLKAYYETIVPARAGESYSVVNLKFKNQIICK